MRAFLPTPVSWDEIEAILEVASTAASGTNVQPWQVHVVSGEVKQRLSEALISVDDDAGSGPPHEPAYDYYPREWVSPYIDRRRKVGFDLYGLLGIARGDKAGMHAQHQRNYAFFDAPVGLFVTMSRVMRTGAFLDCGMFLQAVMVAARARGLDTCPQAAFVKYHRVVAEQLGLDADQVLVCGMSLGHADPSRVENSLVTEREPVARFTTFHGDGV